MSLIHPTIDIIKNSPRSRAVILPSYNSNNKYPTLAELLKERRRLRSNSPNVFNQSSVLN